MDDPGEAPTAVKPFYEPPASRRHMRRQPSLVQQPAAAPRRQAHDAHAGREQRAGAPGERVRHDGTSQGELPRRA